MISDDCKMNLIYAVVAAIIVTLACYVIVYFCMLYKASMKA